ncbi:MAG: hypothetical protein KKH61_20920 [Gammaproteobacteria bacterium]|nr:hypothetical protein [Gammaproteobacteria bacterium]
MSSTLIQAGTDLYLVDEVGVLTGPLTLPTNITLRDDIPPRFVAYANQVVLVNTPSQPIVVTSTGTTRLLCPRPPRTAPVLSSAAGGSLAGTYNDARYTYITKDSSGRIVSESDYSPASNSITLTGAYLNAANLDLSSDDISARRMYRPTNGGAVLFQWLDVNGNTVTSVQDDLADAGLSLVSSPTELGTPPDLTLIAEFRNRLWGVDRIHIDDLRHSGVDRVYAWPADNVFPIPSIGSDAVGIKALMPRRESLGIGRQNQLLMLTGEDDTNFRVAKLSQNLGVISQESVAIYRDVAYFLWEDGVYQWGDDGIFCLSDGRVRSWFTTDDTFDRGSFQYAFGHIDPIRLKYRLFLYDADGAVWWIEYDLVNKTWWGPHKTSAFTPSSVFNCLDSDMVQRPTIGGVAGYIYREQDTRTDGTATAIAFDVTTKRFAGDEPDLNKYWGETSVVGKAQSVSSTMNIAISVGELNATTTQTLQWDMTMNRQRLARAGTGKHLQMEFTNSEVGKDVELYGVEINPIHVLGRR